MKRRIMLVLALSLALGTLVFGVGATAPAPIITVEFVCLPALGAGVPVGVLIGGPNCNCPKSAVTGFTDSSGGFTAVFDLMGCHPGTGDCFAYATAGGPPVPCKGRGELAAGGANQTIPVTGVPTKNDPVKRRP